MGSSLGSEEEGLAWPRGASGMRGQLRSLGGGAPSLLASGRPRTEENKAGRDLGWRREAEQTPGGNIQQARGDRAGYGPGESPSRVEPGFPNLGRPWQDRGRWEGQGRAHNFLPASASSLSPSAWTLSPGPIGRMGVTCWVD